MRGRARTTRRANFSDGKWSGALSIAQPMFADDETIRTCASAAEITTWAKLLKSVWPSGSAFIRLGWESQFSIHDTACGDVHPAAAAEYRKLWSKPYEQR